MEEKIILFPKMRESLERDAEKLMGQGLFETAHDKLCTLLSYGHHSHKVFVQILICLIKLRKLTEARDFCESLLSDKTLVNYYDYLDYYVMILYEENRFAEVVDVLEEEKDRQPFPAEYQEKFTEIARLATQMNEWEAIDLVRDIHQAVNDNLPRRQYYLLQKWQQLNVTTPLSFYPLLVEKKIHPVIKTMLFTLLQKEKINALVTIHKMNRQMDFIPAEMPKMKQHPVYKGTVAHFEDIIQKDPILYQHIMELYDQYCYIMYPFFYDADEINHIADALIQIGRQLLYGNKHIAENAHVKNIQRCYALYQDVVLQ